MAAGCENADPTPRSPTYVSDSEVVDLDPLAVRSPEERADRLSAAFCGRRLEVAVYGKPLSYRLDRTFRVLMESDSGTEKTVAALYDLPSGWSFSIPGPEDSVCQPPASCTLVFLKQLEFGLRFPLHPFINLLLRRANVAITQLHPLAIRTMMAWTWVCLFKGWELSVDVFRSLHYLKMGTGPSEGYRSLYTESSYCTSYPKLTSVKGWRERWLFIRSSAPFDHPRHFRNDVHARFEAAEEWCPGKVQPVTDIYLTPDQTKVREYFRACHNKKSEALPRIWLPPVDEELACIGLNADSTPVTNDPDVLSPSGKISLRTKIMELKKLGSGKVKARMPLHRSEEPAGPSRTRVVPTDDSTAGLAEVPVSEPKSKSRPDHEPAQSNLGPSNGMKALEVAEEIPLRSKKVSLNSFSGSRLFGVIIFEVSQSNLFFFSLMGRASGVVSTASAGAVAARAPSVPPIVSTEAGAVQAPGVALIPSTRAAAIGTPNVAPIPSTGAAAVRTPGVALIPSNGAAAMGTPSVAHIPSTGATAVRTPDVALIPSSGAAAMRTPSVAPIPSTWAATVIPTRSFSQVGVIHALNRAHELCREAEVKFSAKLADVKGELVDVLSKFGTQNDELRAAKDKCELVEAERDKLREELVLLRGELEASRASEAAVRAELESARVSEAAAKTVYADLKGTLDQVNALRVEAYNKGYIQGDLDTKDVVAELYPNFDFEALLLLEEKRDKRRAAGSLK
ncbi:hypothetical protein RND81_03G100800 [Saponaria officinalis]|uniref:Uncharacterized protein n=1 Tax=Saponaria officinalis TaxID=3572 RepID=A0AAW1M6F8_SAPOF